MPMPRKKKRETRKLTPAQTVKLGELVAAGEQMQPVMLRLQEIAGDTLRIFIPNPELAYGVEHAGKYSADMHAKVCRLKFLGLSDAATARALRISPSTMIDWKIKYPQLACDMETAKELANADAAGILKELMDGDGPTAFNAVRYFLSSHSPEFREPSAVPPPTDINVTIQQIRQQIYGLPPERKSVTAESVDSVQHEQLVLAEEPECTSILDNL